MEPPEELYNALLIVWRGVRFYAECIDDEQVERGLINRADDFHADVRVGGVRGRTDDRVAFDV